MDRNTRQRQAIQLVLKASDRPLNVQEVFDAARSVLPGLGIATVYRTIKGLIEEGQLVPVEIPGQVPHYETAGKTHHHHFQCRKCTHIFELDACFSDLKKLAPPGFRSQGHDIVLYGTCRTCNKKS